MAVEAVGDILPVGYALDNAVFSPELLHLQAAEVFCRSRIDGIEVPILFFVFINLLVDMFQDFNGKLAVFYQRLAIVEPLQFVECRNAKRCRCRFQQWLNLIMYAKMTAIKPTLAVCKGIGAGPHFPQIGISTDMQLAYQFQIIIQHIVEVFALLPGLCQNHWQMQADHADVKPPHKNRMVVLILWIHAAPFIPWGQECTAAHGADDFAIPFIHACNITFASQA